MKITSSYIFVNIVYSFFGVLITCADCILFVYLTVINREYQLEN